MKLQLYLMPTVLCDSEPSSGACSRFFRSIVQNIRRLSYIELLCASLLALGSRFPFAPLARRYRMGRLGKAPFDDPATLTTEWTPDTFVCHLAELARGHLPSIGQPLLPLELLQDVAARS